MTAFLNPEKRALAESEVHTGHAKAIPYSNHINNKMVRLESGAVCMTFRLKGISFQTADQGDIQGWHDRLERWIHGIGSPDIGVWTHLVRSEHSAIRRKRFRKRFAQELNDAYMGTIQGESMRLNELYLSLVVRVPTDSAAGFLGKFFKPSHETMQNREAVAVERLAELEKQVMNMLSRYEPQALGIYQAGGTLFSETAEFYGYLVNGYWQRIPVTRFPLRETIACVRPTFGNESHVISGPVNVKYGAFLSFAQYPEKTGPSMLNELLVMPFDLVMSQSYTFMTKSEALKTLELQQGLLKGSGEEVDLLVDELEHGKKLVGGNQMSMGQYHVGIQVMADGQNDLERRENLQDNISRVKEIFNDEEVGIALKRCDVENEAMFWAQLPGQFEMRPRLSPISSRNFCAFSCFHNFPTGKIDGNFWGDYLTVMRQDSGSPYFLNLHVKDVGHTFIGGPTGAGKTVVETFLLSQCDQYEGFRCVAFDKDNGLKPFILGMGGTYHAIKPGTITGWNPFAMEATEANMQFVTRLLMQCCFRGKDVRKRVSKVLDLAVRAVFAQEDASLRRMLTLQNFVDVTEEDGLYDALSEWWEDGRHAWVFDNIDDTFDVHASDYIGIDITAILNMPEVCEPAIQFMNHRLSVLWNGQPLTVVFAEFWKYLTNDFVSDMAKDGLKTDRKKNVAYIFDTQEIEDVANSPIASTIISQCKTKIFLPDFGAKETDYCDRMQLSYAELQVIRDKGVLQERAVLVKQGDNSAVLNFNLAGLERFIRVLSGTLANVQILDEILEEFDMNPALGADPDVWLPEFYTRTAEQRMIA